MYISVVEDNLGVLTMVETALHMYGHSVETHSSSLSFLSALQKTERTPAYDLVIIDLFLDQHSGIDIVEKLQRAYPRMIASIVMSAAGETTFAPIRKRYPDLLLLKKPFTIQMLMSLIKQATCTPDMSYI